MKFSVIYSVDVPKSVKLRAYLPKQMHLFNVTEDDDQYEYDYLGGDWKGGKHRKLCALLTRAQFEKFLSDTCLYAEDVETMGSLGAPGCGLGISPAISFNGRSEEAILNAYVTPIPDVPFVFHDDPERGEKAWQRIRKAILNTWGV